MELNASKTSATALIRAEKVQKKARKVGFDWKDADEAFPKIAEETAELYEAVQSGTNVNEEAGDLLFAVVNLIRFRKRASAEEIMRAANRKFVRRFKAVEEMLEREHIALAEAGTEKLEELWREVKTHE